MIAVSQEDPFGLGDLEGDIPGSGGEAAAIVAAAIALPRLIAIIPGRLGQMFPEFKISLQGQIFCHRSVYPCSLLNVGENRQYERKLLMNPCASFPRKGCHE